MSELYPRDPCYPVGPGQRMPSPYLPGARPSRAMAGWALGLSIIPCLLGLIVSVVLAIVV